MAAERLRRLFPGALNTSPITFGDQSNAFKEIKKIRVAKVAVTSTANRLMPLPLVPPERLWPVAQSADTSVDASKEAEVRLLNPAVLDFSLAQHCRW